MRIPHTGHSDHWIHSGAGHSRRKEDHAAVIPVVGGN